jgi:protocatechuate 3,4-dioxygenase beta subunit
MLLIAKQHTATMKRNFHICFFISFILCSALAILLIPQTSTPETCAPTPPDMLGPFYKPGAPERSVVGRGYILTGTVKSSVDCSPVRRAKIEFWLTGPDGNYGDDHRATVYSETSGTYRFESNEPKPYVGRPPHIHIRVSAEGFKVLVTQLYPKEGKSDAIFDLVLIPSR